MSKIWTTTRSGSNLTVYAIYWSSRFLLPNAVCNTFHLEGLEREMRQSQHPLGTTPDSTFSPCSGFYICWTFCSWKISLSMQSPGCGNLLLISMNRSRIRHLVSGIKTSSRRQTTSSLILFRFFSSTLQSTLISDFKQRKK